MDNIAPNVEIKRKSCPFYGFHPIMGRFLDSEGNQCPLIKGSYSPCQMEIGGLETNWDKCEFNTLQMRNSIQENKDVMVYPRETLEGLSFENWMKHVMKK